MRRFSAANQAIAIWHHFSIQKKKLLAPVNRELEAFLLNQKIQQVPPIEALPLTTGGRA